MYNCKTLFLWLDYLYCQYIESKYIYIELDFNKLLYKYMNLVRKPAGKINSFVHFDSSFPTSMQYNKSKGKS